VALDDALAVAVAAAPDARRAAEEELLVDAHQLVLPEGLAVENVRGVDLGGDATRQVLDPFAGETALDGGVVAVGLGVALFEEGEPGLVGVLALGEVQGAAVGLVGVAVGLLGVDSVSIFPVT
jgi:hypothetical protein